MKFKSAVADPQGWQTLSTEKHFGNANLDVATEEVRSPGSRKARQWTVVHRKPAVVVAAMTTEGQLVLVRQERIPIRAAIWEMPAGQVDDPSARDQVALEAVALRELREETGYQLCSTGELISLGDYFSSPGFTDEQGYFYLARPAEVGSSGAAHTESESILECRAFFPDEICRMIATNEIRDANTLSAWAKLTARGLLSLRA